MCVIYKKLPHTIHKKVTRTIHKKLPRTIQKSYPVPYTKSYPIPYTKSYSYHTQKVTPYHIQKLPVPSTKKSYPYHIAYLLVYELVGFHVYVFVIFLSCSVPPSFPLTYLLFAILPIICSPHITSPPVYQPKLSLPPYPPPTGIFLFFFLFFFKVLVTGKSPQRGEA